MDDDLDPHDDCTDCGDTHPVAVMENGLCPVCADFEWGEGSLDEGDG